MNQTNDGGAAFPWTNCETHGISGGYGMSLRDYFAAAAVQSFIEAFNGPEAERFYGGMGDQKEIARLAYQLADAMLAERSK